MYSVVTLFTGVSVVCFIISQIGNLHAHYRSRLRSYEKAQTYLKSDLCTNPRVKARLGEFNLCDQSEEIMDKPPLFTAIVDTAEDIHICGNGYCSVLGHNITNSLPQIILAFGIIAILMIWASGIQIRRNREENKKRYWSLPGLKAD